MEIRQLRQDEYEASVELSEYAFQYQLSAEEKETRKKRFKPEQYWGVFEEGALQAKLTLIPFQVHMQGRVVEMGGIAGVATWPENRRKGHVAALLKHALETMKNQGQTISFLHPFSIPFYRKFGWELFTDFKKYNITADKFPSKKAVSGKIVRGVTDISVYNSLYNSFAKGYNGTLVRDEDWWENSVFDSSLFRAVYYTADDEPQGYVLYKIKDKELICDEFIFMNEEARSALWTFFANHDSRIDQVKLIMVPSDDLLPFMLPNPYIIQETVPYFMARIVDVQSFIKQYTFTGKRDSEVRLTILVNDPTAPWNEGCWNLTVDEAGRADLIKLSIEEETAPQLALDIQALTALLMGYKRPRELAQMDCLHGEALIIDLFESIIPYEKTWLLDHF
ncbi:GNAT family N-acetyltransferase [Paenibacillus dakarensis]|uniref:GNAT family N-acetyltransferase n=1 Tax=Paenibacillus dakarensis TaxID=1527293 RepID=UPI0006D5470E|nr:GNAT family N-acetyltransferase [Paenibacillus dakarensis]